MRKAIVAFFAVLLSFFCFTGPCIADAMYDKITEAQILLRASDQVAGCGTKSRPCITEHGFKRANVILAVSCGVDTPTKIVRLPFNKRRVDGYRFGKGSRNNSMRQFWVRSPRGCVVLAVKSTVRATEGGYKEIVYTPYSQAINTSAIRLRGLEYLSRVVVQAHSELIRDKVTSYAFPNQSVSRVVPVSVAMKLALVEHADPSLMTRDPSKWKMGEVLVVLATNGPDAFRYSVSPAKANGLFQLTPRTYYAIYKRYPGAQLKQDFVAGAQDHVNAAKAALLLFDSDIGELSKPQREAMLHDRGAQAEYLAAAYNGGSARAKKAIGYDLKLRVHMLFAETRGYLYKLKRVGDTLPRMYAYDNNSHIFGA